MAPAARDVLHRRQSTQPHLVRVGVRVRVRARVRVRVRARVRVKVRVECRAAQARGGCRCR